MSNLSDRKGALLLGAAAVGTTVWVASRWRRGGGGAGPAPTSFEAYLRQVEEPAAAGGAFSATSFEAYLRAPAAGPAAAAPAGGGGGGSGAAAVPLDRVPVTVLFGTEYGFSKEIAEKLAERLKDTERYWCVHRRIVGGCRVSDLCLRGGRVLMRTRAVVCAVERLRAKQSA